MPKDLTTMLAVAAAVVGVGYVLTNKRSSSSSGGSIIGPLPVSGSPDQIFSGAPYGDGIGGLYYRNGQLIYAPSTGVRGFTSITGFEA
ncbi:hypothetical protein [Rhodocyclus gracilis]|uniref:Uncharacterized protein n=1 Tax=Rhodocyclus tenuis TaxID=1066 RepID=A0A6L5JXA2_RHOTE|nr:hypothetical protein [Rhodocyclus gracilis]MQY50828.1 hypothetical protein [Rhodocyclus gracilis]